MGRGGARPNSGPKPKLKPVAATVRPRRVWGVDDLARMMEVLKRQSGKARTQENSPFRLPAFPKGAVPRGGGMAQDQAICGSMAWANEGWLAGSMFDGIASEGLAFPGYAFLAQLAQRPEYRLMSEIIATEATRKWIRFKSTGEDEEDKDDDDKDDGEERDDLAGDRDLDDAAIERAVSQLMGDKPGAKPGDKPNGKGGKGENEKQKKITELTDFLDNELKVRKWFMEVCLHDGFFGRGHLLLDGGKDSEGAELATAIGSGRDATTLGKVTKGWLKSIRTIEPVWAYPQVYNAQNPLAPNWYNPQQWYVMGQEIHATRLLKFVAREVPDILKPSYAFGGLSMSQMASPYIDMWLQTSRSVNQLIHSFSVMVLKTDMGAMTEPGGAADMIARLALFNQFRDNGSTYVLDEKTEDFANVSATLSGLHELQAQAQEHMAFVGRYPLLKFTGIQPSGLNASSEGELRTFYDNVHAYQEWLIRPGLQTVVDIAMLTLWGAIDRDIVFEFVPLWGMSEKEEAEVRKMDAETDQIRVDGGVVSQEEARKKLAADPSSPYQGLDPDDVPDLQEEEAGGLMPGGKKPGGTAGGGEGGEGGGFPEGGGSEGGAGADAAIIPFAGDAAGEFQEGDHPRDQGGKFTSGGGTSGKGKAAGSPKPAGGGKGSGGSPGTPHAPQYGLQHGVLTASHGSSGGFSPAPPKTNIGAPIDPKGMKKVGGQKGSNPGGVYEDAEGKRFYVKAGKTKDHVRNEMTAAALYDLAGTPTLRYRPTEDGTHVATEMAKLDKSNVKELDAKERAEARADFMVNAWLANWDAVGLGGDNIGTVRGVPTALDLGGALDYRAQGGPKGKAFGTSVGEIDTLRDKAMNPDAAGLYGDMTPAEMRASARYVTRLTDDKIRAAVEKAGSPAALADKLIARRDDIAARARTFGAEGDPKKATSTMVVPAGEAPPVKALNGVAFAPYRAPADWAGVEGQADIAEPELVVPEGKRAASGVVIREKDGRVWMVQPRGGFGGYEATFPKGGAEKGLSLQANAIKEAYEESGLKVRIVSHLGDHEGDTSMTRYYVAEREGGDPSRHDDESEGVVLVPRAKAGGFISRKRDRDVVGGLGDDQALGAMDEFEESKHPRDDDGKFASGGSGGSGSSAGAGSWKSALPGFGTEKGPFGGLWKDKGADELENLSANIAHVLGKPATAGSNYRRMLSFLIKKAAANDFASLPQLKAKLIDAWAKAGQNLYDKGDQAGATAIHKKLQKMEKEFGLPASAPPIMAPAAPAALEPKKETPPPAASKFPAPTEGEIAKAKKNVALQLQYVPGAPQTPEAQKLVDAFNAKYAGKEITLQPALVQKVNDFKIMQQAMVPLMSAQQKAQAEAQAKAQAEQAKEQEKFKVEQIKKEAAAKESHAKIKEALGITDSEAKGFEAMISMLGVSSLDSAVKKFKSMEASAKSKGYSELNGFENSLISLYTGPGSGAINSALRYGAMTEGQFVYMKHLNKAIDKLPKFSGLTKRWLDLKPDDKAKYKVGQVVKQHNFSSTRPTGTWSGNTIFHITAIGERGASVQKLSAYPNEDEVLYKAGTFMRVDKVEDKGGTFNVHLTELSHHD